MITYDKGLPSLPDDIICEIFDLLDTEALKSCSLTSKPLSCSAKPFLHRVLCLTPRSKGPTNSVAPGRWNEFEGLRILGERGLLQHTRRISVSLHCNPIFVHDLEPHIQQLRTLTNLRSLRIRRLDIPSFIPKMEECFGAVLGSLQSLGLESPRGEAKQILYFICQFRNLQDLKINDFQSYFHPWHINGSNVEIKTSPPFNGTLDLNLVNTGSASINWKGDQLVLSDLLALPSGFKFRTLKLSGCVGNNLQLLVDACQPTLECMELTVRFDGRLFITWKGNILGLHNLTLSRLPMSSAQLQTPPKIPKTRNQTDRECNYRRRYQMVIRNPLNNHLERVHRADHPHQPHFVRVR